MACQVLQCTLVLTIHGEPGQSSSNAWDSGFALFEQREMLTQRLSNNYRLSRLKSLSDLAF